MPTENQPLNEVDLERWDAAPFLEKVTHIVPNIIYVFNQKTQSNEYTNRGLGESMGYTAEEVADMGANLMPTVCHPDDFPKILKHFERLRNLNDGEVCQFEYRVKHKDGGWRWLLSYDTVFDRDENGAVLRHIGVAADFTKQKEAEFAAQSANTRLKSINEELSELAYVASHDMKSPISNIMGLATHLSTMPQIKDSEASSFIELILQSCTQAIEKLEDVVRVAQSRNLQQTARHRELDLLQIVNKVILTLQTDIKLHEATVEVDVSKAPKICFSALQIESILENLINNALKYRKPDTRPHVTITSQIDEERCVQLIVKDNGIGIDTQRDGLRIFGLFKRLNQSQPGSGIGLYLVKQMIQRAGGSIKVDGAPGKGASFMLTFPKLNG